MVVNRRSLKINRVPTVRHLFNFRLRHKTDKRLRQKREIADYCETDIVNTYRVWLRYELFRGRLSEDEYNASEQNLADYIKAHGNTKQHLME